MTARGLRPGRPPPISIHRKNGAGTVRAQPNRGLSSQQWVEGPPQQTRTGGFRCAETSRFIWSLFFRRVSHSVKSALKGLEIIDIFKSFLVRRHKTMTAENQNPTKANLFILSRFNSIEECTYRSSVMVVLACPRISLKDLISKPTSTHRVAKVCLSVWK